MTTTHHPEGGYRALLMLAWPIVIARASQAVVGFCDVFMVAHLGKEVMGATVMGAMNILSFLIFPMGVIFIVQSFSAQFSAKSDWSAARRYGWYAIVFALACGLASLLAIPAIEDILAVVTDYDPATRTLMGDYLAIRLLAVFPVLGIEAVGNWYGGTGNTRIHAQVGLSVMVLNIFLNWVFIDGNLGAPALGLEGAALASVLASAIGFIGIFYVFARQRQLEHKVTERFQFRWPEFRRMLRFGLPAGMNWFLEFAAFIIFLNFFVADLGPAVVAAMGVVVQINAVSFMPGFGIATAGSILVGQAIGGQRKHEVRSIVIRTIIVAACWQCTVGLLYLLMPEALMELFRTPDADGPEIVKLGVVMLSLSAAWQLFDSFALSLGEALRAAGDTAWAMWARVAVAWALFIPASYLSVRHWGGGHVAAILCIVGYIFILAVALLFRFASGRWKRIDLTG